MKTKLDIQKILNTKEKSSKKSTFDQALLGLGVRYTKK